MGPVALAGASGYRRAHGVARLARGLARRRLRGALGADRRASCSGPAPALAHHVDPGLDGGRRRGRPRLSRDRRGVRLLSQIFLRHDQDHHRAAALRDAGRRHRRPLRPEAGRAHGRQGARLLRGRHDARAVHRPGRDQHHAGRASAIKPRRRRCTPRTARRRQADRGRHHPARLPGEHRQVGGRRPGAADRGLQHAVRHRAGAAARGEAPADARLRRKPRRDDVQVHQHRDAVRARSASARRSPTPSATWGSASW